MECPDLLGSRPPLDRGLGMACWDGLVPAGRPICRPALAPACFLSTADAKDLDANLPELPVSLPELPVELLLALLAVLKRAIILELIKCVKGLFNGKACCLDTNLFNRL